MLAPTFTATPALAAGDANQATCPPETESSPGFRSYLPDCRAYELVSPPYKQGFEFKPGAVSPDGSRVIGASLGAFADLPGGDYEGGEFELSRSPLGWEARSISPPASLLPAEKTVAANLELTETLVHGRTAAESFKSDNFYRRAADGAVAEVGPLLPPYITAGSPAEENQSFGFGAIVGYDDSSADLTHVFFTMPNPKEYGWIGDETEADSLLEYSGTGESEPVLVGVAPGESKDRPSEHPALVSDCGTELGSDNDLYNAVSASGAVVFFTAKDAAEDCHASVAPEVNELYARVAGRETVAISEPSAADCEACDTSVKANANFAGASEDGSKVFFLTEQQLLPGAEGPNLYEYDFDSPAGQRILRVSAGSESPQVQGVARVSEDGSHVYFVASGVLSGPNAEGHAPSPAAGAHNLYVFQRDATHPAGRLAFIATLSSEDSADWQQRDVREVQVTPDGRFLVFASTAHLTPDDTSAEPQIFEYDALTETLVRVSRGADDDEPAGTESANQHRAEISSHSFMNGQSESPASRLAVSDDGATVVFASGGALTLGAAVEVPGRFPRRGQYEYHSTVAAGGTIAAGDVYLIEASAQGFPIVDESGQNVFFLSPASLVPQDTDTQFDYYDARIDGGFPAPVSAAACEGATCGAPPVPGVPVTSPSSATAGGPGNLTPAPPTSPPKPATPLTRAQKLAKALRACRKDRRRPKRTACERAAHRRYAPERAKNANYQPGDQR